MSERDSMDAAAREFFGVGTDEKSIRLLASLLRRVRDEETRACVELCYDLPTNKARCEELLLPSQAWDEATEACAEAIRARLTRASSGGEPKHER